MRTPRCAWRTMGDASRRRVLAPHSALRWTRPRRRPASTRCRKWRPRWLPILEKTPANQKLSISTAMPAQTRPAGIRIGVRARRRPGPQEVPPAPPTSATLDGQLAVRPPLPPRPVHVEGGRRPQRRRGRLDPQQARANAQSGRRSWTTRTAARASSSPSPTARGEALADSLLSLPPPPACSAWASPATVFPLS